MLATTVGPDSLFEDRIHRTKQKGPPVTPVLNSPPGLMQMDVYRLFPCCYKANYQVHFKCFRATQPLTSLTCRLEKPLSFHLSVQ